MIDVFGHIGYVTLVLGVLMISHHRAQGWILRCLGSGIWFFIGLEMGMSSIWVWSAVFMAMDFYGWMQWRNWQKARGDV